MTARVPPPWQRPAAEAAPVYAAALRHILTLEALAKAAGRTIRPTAAPVPPPAPAPTGEPVGCRRCEE